MELIHVINDIMQCPRCTYQDDPVFMEFLGIFEEIEYYIIQLKYPFCFKVYRCKINMLKFVRQDSS